ncbi:tyrosine-type recombinase/integrase [Halorussus lipolyticus]|uniref:tyrosine-type recombinase/integrase n=1 Tax=Halorussus lipolyticus TaxID=3034024 RepID=UPI0023E787B3|nr:tyrosine-type recombinase/integrase [Halorussus sp. DT80]
MTTNQKLKLSDFTDNESNNESDHEVSNKATSEETSNPSKSSTPSEQPNQIPAPDSQEQCNEPICPTYHEERIDERWQHILDEHLNGEPKCGHAIDFLRRKTGTTLTSSTASAYCDPIRFYISFLHDRGVNACEADLRDLREYFNQRVRANRSESTLEGDRTALANLYKHIELYRDIEPTLSRALILEEIDPSKYQTKERIEREPLTKELVIQLFDAMDRLMDRLIVQIGVELGPRNIDICKLETGDVDLDEKKITLSNTKAGGSYTLPISDGLALSLRRWIEVERPATGVAEDNPYLFPSREGGRYRSGSLRNIVRQAAERAGIQEVIGEIPMTENQKEMLGTDKDVRNAYRVDVHTFRHTFNYLMDEADVPRDARSAALDHSSTEVTEEFYDHNESNYQELLERLFSGLSGFGFDDDVKSD